MCVCVCVCVSPCACVCACLCHFFHYFWPTTVVKWQQNFISCCDAAHLCSRIRSNLVGTGVCQRPATLTHNRANIKTQLLKTGRVLGRLYQRLSQKCFLLCLLPSKLSELPWLTAVGALCLFVKFLHSKVKRWCNTTEAGFRHTISCVYLNPLCRTLQQLCSSKNVWIGYTNWNLAPVVKKRWL